MLSREYVAEALSYNPDTGVFTWKQRPRHHFKSDADMRISNTRFAGTEAGYIVRGTKHGYRSITVGGTDCVAHRLAWLIHYGEWPRHEIDHINHDRADNRIDNLREAPGFSNQRNKSLYKNNTSGFVGVAWQKSEKLWRAKIQFKGKTITLCRNKDLFEAICSRKSAENKYGFHRNHGMQLTEVTT